MPQGPVSGLNATIQALSSFKTNFFELFFFRKASGWLRYGFQHIALKDNTVLILSPHIHQEWHIDESQTDYRFLIFRDDFLSTYLADPFFTYRLLYCYQTDFPPYLLATVIEQQEYERLLVRIKEELNHPLRNYAPGQHGNQRKKISEYGLQLQEKQKLRHTYGMNERQFATLFRKAGKIKTGKHGENFMALLETRLDNYSDRKSVV